MDQIGKYTVLEEIGQGGMGVVYKARDPVIGREVAIKVISERTMRSPNLRARFLREIASAGRLSHENIMTIYDAGDHDGRPYFVMELLGGTDLSRAIHRDAFSLDDKLSIALQVARGLCYAHGRRVIHRDIKPDNIRVLESGRAKIMDFGIARIESETHTPTHTSIGTPRYMSPEQIKGEPVDQRTDVFSYGALIYELFSGRPPFNGERITTVIYKILHEDPEPLDLGSGSDMDALRRVVERCLEKELSARYPNFEAVIADLEAVLAERSAAGPTATLPPPPDDVLRDETVLNLAGAPSLAEKRSGRRSTKLSKSGPQTEAADAPPAAPKKKKVVRSGVLLGSGVALVLLVLTFALTRPGGEPEPPAPTATQQPEAGDLLALDGEAALLLDPDALDDEPADEPEPEAAPEPPAEDVVEASPTRAEAQRTQMRSARARAEQADAAALASTLYDRALAQERAGDTAFRRGTAAGYAAAQTVYAEAARLYDQARREAGQRQEQRQEAEAARTAMTQAHAAVVDRRADPRIAADFQQAETRRATGERQLRDGDFQQAAASFAEARTLYAAAAETASRPVAESTPPEPDPDPPEPSPEERAQAAAEQAAGSAAARLKQALEQENAAAMRDIHSTYGGWDGFFRVAENVRATVSVQSVQVSGSTATADVSVLIRFRNTSKNADEDTDLRYAWTLERRGAAWVLASVATR